MKRNNSFISYSVITLILLCYGCNNAPDNVAISSDGVNINFSQQGNGNLALIFVHGWSNTKSIWDEQISRFSEKYKVIAVDLPGFGESGYKRTKWTMKSFGEDVSAVIKKLNLNQVVLIGFSIGAPVVIEAAIKDPEHIIGLVLVDDLKDVEMKYPPEMISYVDSLLMDLVTNPTNEKLVNNGFYKNNPDVSYKRVVSMLDSHKNKSRIGWKESLDGYFIWSNGNCIESLKKLTCPVVSINSDIEPTNVEGFQKYVPAFQTKIITNVGHLIMWDAPEEFNRSLGESIQGFVSKSKLE